MTMTMPENICAITVLMLSVISVLDTAPLGQASCKAAVQRNGSFVFQLWLEDSTKYFDCEPRILIEGTVCAVYEGGKVPASWLPPVLEATIYNFTLSRCPKSVKIGLDCAHLLPYAYLPCSCDTSASTAQTLSSTDKPPPSASNSPLHWTLHGKSRFPVGAAISCSLFAVVLVILIWRLMKYRGTGVQQTATIVHHAPSFKEETVSILDITATSSLKTSDGQLK